MDTPHEAPPAKDTVRVRRPAQHNSLDELRLDQMMARLRDGGGEKDAPAPRDTQIDGVLQIDALIERAKHAGAEEVSRAS